ncbi:uncharacterized protein LOC144162127 [Haemaphysalis longicornis]
MFHVAVPLSVKLCALVVLAVPRSLCCPCPSWMCTKFQHPCPPVPKHCKGRIAFGAGFCGCCNQCVRQITIGEPCTIPGRCPGSSECGKHLYCDPAQRVCYPYPMFKGQLKPYYSREDFANDADPDILNSSSTREPPAGEIP